MCSVEPPRRRVTEPPVTTEPPSNSTPTASGGVNGKSKDVPHVLAEHADATVVASPTLPFTGINLGAAALFGAALVLLGVALRRFTKR